MGTAGQRRATPRRSGHAARSTAAAVVALAIAAGACADTRDAAPDDTIPRITSDSTTTEPTATEAVDVTTTSPPATTGVTVPLPTQATPPPTAPPTPSAPAPAPTAPSTTGRPAAPSTTQRSGPTSTVVLTPVDPSECSAESITAATGVVLRSNLRCSAGWAIGYGEGCVEPDGCELVDVFHVTEAGWVSDGGFSQDCPETLAGAGMSIYTALTFTPQPCDAPAGPTIVIRPESTGDRVVQLQIALAALGYDVDVDGRYGSRTQAAVRDFQQRNGLEVDGLTGPDTQRALGIGPGASGAVAPPDSAPTWPTSTTAPVDGPTTTSGAVTPGEPAECTPEAIAVATGRTVAGLIGCVGGWALAPEQCPPDATDCLLVDVFHVTSDGWVYDGVFSDSCVDDLTAAGMSVRTAAEFAELCADGLPDQRNILPGTTGPDVEQVQIALVALGYPIAVDATYGLRTEAAVRDFQAASGLEVDGIAGPDTQAALGI